MKTHLYIIVMLFFYPGLADPNALNQAVAAFQACQQIGMPACQVKLNVCIYTLCAYRWGLRNSY